MILPSFTYDELLCCLKETASTLRSRAQSYCEHNSSVVVRKIKQSGTFEREFSAEIKGQRYFQKYNCYRNENGFYLTNSSLVTELSDSQRKFVVAFFPDANNMVDDSRLLKLFTGHFLNRFFERTGLDDTNVDLCHKCFTLLGSSETLVPATVDDDVIRRYGEPKLNMKFLPEGERLTECIYRNNGDIAIVERYGSVAVWRTYITKDMLFISQKESIAKMGVQEVLEKLNYK